MAYSFNRKTTTSKSIGELYFESTFFKDEESKTIGQPIIGENAMTILSNRRKAKGHLTPEGREVLEGILAKVSNVLGMPVKAVWDKHCGCSMCPCSPGYRIKAVFDKGSYRGWRFNSKDETRFNMWVTNDGEITYRTPKSKWNLGYDNHEQLESTFNKK